LIFITVYFIGHGIVLKGIVKYYGHGKNIPHTFGHTAGGVDWPSELRNICTMEEIAQLLIDGDSDSPWVFADGDITALETVPILDHHRKNCVHSGGCEADTGPLDMAPQMILAVKNTEYVERSDIMEVICENCGLFSVVDGVAKSHMILPRLQKLPYM
jgi:hypothetical protein